MNSLRNTPRFFVLAPLLGGCLLILSVAQAEEIPSASSDEVNHFLSEVKSEAIALQRDCDEIALWTNEKQVTWESLANKLHRIREHIDATGRLLNNLQAAWDSASPRQQRAIEHISPLLKDLVDNTEATLNHFNDSRCRIHFSAHSGYAKAGAKLARELANLIGVYVDYGEHESELDYLQEKFDSRVN